MSKANKVENKVLNYIAWMPAVTFLEQCVAVQRDQLLSQYVLAWVPNTCSLDVMLVGLALFKWDKVIRTGGLTLLCGGEFAEPIRLAQEILIGLAQASVGVDKSPRMGVLTTMRDLCVDLMEWYTTERTWVGSDDATSGSYEYVPYNHNNYAQATFMAFQLLRFVHGRTHDLKSFRPIWISAVPDSRQANVVFQELLQFSLLLMQLATQHKNEEHVHVVAAILALVDAMELHIQMLLATHATGNMKVLQQQFYKCMAKVDAMDPVWMGGQFHLMCGVLLTYVGYHGCDERPLHPHIQWDSPSMDQKAWATMPPEEKQEESHTPDKKLDGKAQLGTDDNPGTTAEAGESATGNTNKPPEVIETTEEKTDEMAEGKADVPKANSIKQPDVEKDGPAEEAGNPIEVPGITLTLALTEP
jgi:hypothetical protein